MKLTGAAAIAALFIAGAALADCATPRPFVASGDSKSVQVDYYGDLSATWPLARQYCAGYQRTAKFSYSGDDIAVFDCVAP
jgi:hypothetical protein